MGVIFLSWHTCFGLLALVINRMPDAGVNGALFAYAAQPDTCIHQRAPPHRDAFILHGLHEYLGSVSPCYFADFVITLHR